MSIGSSSAKRSDIAHLRGIYLRPPGQRNARAAGYGVRCLYFCIGEHHRDDRGHDDDRECPLPVHGFPQDLGMQRKAPDRANWAEVGGFFRPAASFVLGRRWKALSIVGVREPNSASQPIAADANLSLGRCAPLTLRREGKGHRSAPHE